MDETSVEYLVSKYSDQFICSLKKQILDEHLNDDTPLRTLCAVSSVDSHLSHLILVF